MDTNVNMTSFWTFLNNNTVKIPIIQRDYAQGREDKVDLRMRFLEDLKAALDKANGDKLILDFVYGSTENNSLKPLDGQQRLTTLWLLHWYISLRAGKLMEASQILKKFTYETRLSSREFCKEICVAKNFDSWKPEENLSIVDFIVDQTWFFSAWKQDPTVKAMLTMLKGTVEADNPDGIDGKDGIEPIFKDVQADEFARYWESLKSDFCPIVFYSMPLEKLHLSDDLYIKMNARGKQLSSFENFKADLTKKINDSGWNSLLDEKDGIPKKLDTDWTDIFWKNNQNGRIDEIYLAFLNRFFLNRYIVSEVEKGISQEKIEKSKTFNNLSKNGIYSSFEDYKWIDEDDLKSLSSILDNTLRYISTKGISAMNKILLPTWNENEDFLFLPKYNKEDISSTWTHKQDVVFHATCKFFEYEKIDEEQLSRWMRVVWNFVESAEIDDNSGMITNILFIDELSSHSHDIYEWLSSKDFNITSDANEEQLEEEREKAKKILESKAWETNILEAEGTAFFNGAIRFLFRNEEGELSDWDNFDTKLKNAKRYFFKDGVTKDYKKNAVLLRSFVSQFDGWGYFWNISYDNTRETWKSFLLSPDYQAPIYELLQNKVKVDEDFSVFSSSLEDDNEKFVQNDLVKTPILTEIAEQKPRLHWYNPVYCMYPKNAKSDKLKWIVGNVRNKILSSLVSQRKIYSEQKMDNCDFFRGWNIEFDYKGETFLWRFDKKLLKWNKDTERYPESGKNVKDVSDIATAKKLLELLDDMCK